MQAAVYVLLMTVVAVSSAQAQTASTRDDGDHRIVYEVGWAADWSSVEGLHPKGGALAFEIPAIERWLELEFGVEAIRADGETETSASVLFKKPWRFSSAIRVHDWCRSVNRSGYRPGRQKVLGTVVGC